MRYRLTGAKKWLVHGPGHSTEEWKVLKEYSGKYAVQRPHTKKQARSSGKKQALLDRQV